MVKKMTWNEFQNHGMLWAVNTFLHMFGLAIVVATDDKTGEIVDVYPAQVDYRGFCPKDVTAGFRKLHRYLENNITEIRKGTN